ncbi:hypothetical protein P154DRAFT_578411 [Amniculicola lignicola CBS 123094]|uniref:Uncharacterized protein n=1 Tax=Amniculicola lignicola CBS 123094 TaxID=1392246 RepID=A0A6A5W7F5_9PLEO|nr:hypothetical protein P154DRAFT_578411 [Amniculicola lignicola CBS 123094]
MALPTLSLTDAFPTAVGLVQPITATANALLAQVRSALRKSAGCASWSPRWRPASARLREARIPGREVWLELHDLGVGAEQSLMGRARWERRLHTVASPERLLTAGAFSAFPRESLL